LIDGDTQAWKDGALSGSNALTPATKVLAGNKNNTIGSTPKSIPGQQTG